MNTVLREAQCGSISEPELALFARHQLEGNVCQQSLMRGCHPRLTSDCAAAVSQAGLSLVAAVTVAAAAAAVAATAAASAVPPVLGPVGATTGPGPSTTAGEDSGSSVPVPTLLAIVVVTSTVSCACISWSCFSRLARSEICTRQWVSRSAFTQGDRDDLPPLAHAKLACFWQPETPASRARFARHICLPVGVGSGVRMRRREKAGTWTHPRHQRVDLCLCARVFRPPRGEARPNRRARVVGSAAEKALASRYRLLHGAFLLLRALRDSVVLRPTVPFACTREEAVGQGQ